MPPLSLAFAVTVRSGITCTHSTTGSDTRNARGAANGLDEYIAGLYPDDQHTAGSRKFAQLRLSEYRFQVCSKGAGPSQLPTSWRSVHSNAYLAMEGSNNRSN